MALTALINSTPLVLTLLNPSFTTTIPLLNGTTDFALTLQRFADVTGFLLGESRYYSVECLISTDAGLSFTSLGGMEIRDEVVDSMEPGGANLYMSFDDVSSRLLKIIITRILGTLKLQASAQIT